MAVYVVGDIQGCFKTLKSLLRYIDFNSKKDQLWCTGDLVNRGPRSLDVLRWVSKNDHCVRTVLGNHDLALIGLFHGLIELKSHTLEEVLQAKDGHDLIEWLRRQPLMIRKDNYVLVHAGLLPVWSTDQAEGYCHEVEAFLQGKDFNKLLRKYDISKKIKWSSALKGLERQVSVLQSVTTVRYCGKSGRTLKMLSCHPKDATKDALPWFRFPDRRSQKNLILFGHWASLGLYQEPGIYALDSGCVYGNQLTAMRLEDGKIFQVPYVDD